MWIHCGINVKISIPWSVWRSDWGSIPEVWVFAHENMSCARKHFCCAQKIFSSQIYISHVPKNNYMNAKIFIWLPRNSLACAEIFGLAQKYLAHPRKIMWCAEIFSSRAILFYFARKLSHLTHRFYCLKPFWECRGAVVRNWSIVGSFGTLVGVINYNHFYYISF